MGNESEERPHVLDSLMMVLWLFFIWESSIWNLDGALALDEARLGSEALCFTVAASAVAPALALLLLFFFFHFSSSATLTLLRFLTQKTRRVQSILAVNWLTELL